MPWLVARQQATDQGLVDRPLVFNLGELLAGPLAARLLGLSGDRVIHVEIRTRLDPTRESSPAFWQLRGGQEVRSLDFE